VVRGRRMSGDMCTSLGNSFTNAMLWSFFMARKNNDPTAYVYTNYKKQQRKSDTHIVIIDPDGDVSLHFPPGIRWEHITLCDLLSNEGVPSSAKGMWIQTDRMRHGDYLWRGFVEGDDGLFAIYRGKIPTPDDFASLGFVIKLAKVDDPCKASFCGIICVDDTIIRDPIRFIANFGWTSSFTTAGLRVRMGLLRAKALSAVYETPQCPVVGAMARFALRVTRGYAPRFVPDGYHVCPPDELPIPAFGPSDHVRQLFDELFGVSPIAQMEIERKIDSGQFDELESLFPHNQAHARHECFYVV